MKEIITTGKTVDLAIEEACRQLQTAREKVEQERQMQKNTAMSIPM